MEANVNRYGKRADGGLIGNLIFVYGHTVKHTSTWSISKLAS